MSTDNHNELNSLFQRASENYPIKTDSANWSAVLEKLEKDADQKGILLKKRLLMLLILLLLGIFSWLFVNFFRIDTVKSKTSPIEKQEKEAEKKLVKKITDAVYEKIMDSINQNNIINNNDNVATLNNTLLKPTPKYNRQTASNSSTIKNNSAITPPPIINPLAVDQNKPIADAANLTSTASAFNTPVTKTGVEKLADSVDVAALMASNQQHTENAATANSVIVSPKKAAFKPEFYTGIMYANDKSSINFEASKGSGYSLAFVLGYQFSKRFSIETGIHIEKKEYYTKGEHFDKSILPATGKILWIESENKLIEIPISLKSDLIKKKKHQLFGSFGISSFLVNNESYEYEEEVNGVIQNESVEFTKNSSNLFATVNMSVGYELKIKNNLRLRLEPYLNLPLSGIGKGKEPVLSKGVYFGLLYNFHKN